MAEKPRHFVLDEDTSRDGLGPKIGAMVGILVLSLFASAFPTVSKRVPYIRIHHLVFFVLKHFGTGVILSTAFVHLLQDAFESLLSPGVLEGWMRHWVGLLVLLSLAFIFLVEYVSMALVQRLEGGDFHSHHHHFGGASSHTHDDHQSQRRSTALSESTDLLQHDGPAQTYGSAHSAVRSEAMSESTHADHDDKEPSSPSEPYFSGHHRFEPSASHSLHNPRSRRTPSVWTLHDAIAHGEPMVEQTVIEQSFPADQASTRSSMVDSTSAKHQIVNTVVLQLGIMLHSLAIGLTLSIKSRSEFISLLTAISFHQLFEGLSLGVRISALPKSLGKGAHIGFLKPLLCLLFSITAPVGIIIGLTTFTTLGTQMKLIQGIMSAISAGMLIYAACCELLAADFILDVELKKSSFGIQALALFSLVMGLTGMAVLNIWH